MRPLKYRFHHLFNDRFLIAETIINRIANIDGLIENGLINPDYLVDRLNSARDNFDVFNVVVSNHISLSYIDITFPEIEELKLSQLRKWYVWLIETYSVNLLPKTAEVVDYILKLHKRVIDGETTESTEWDVANELLDDVMEPENIRAAYYSVRNELHTTDWKVALYVAKSEAESWVTRQSKNEKLSENKLSEEVQKTYNNIIKKLYEHISKIIPFTKYKSPVNLLEVREKEMLSVLLEYVKKLKPGEVLSVYGYEKNSDAFIFNFNDRVISFIKNESTGRYGVLIGADTFCSIDADDRIETECQAIGWEIEEILRELVAETTYPFRKAKQESNKIFLDEFEALVAAANDV